MVSEVPSQPDAAEAPSNHPPASPAASPTVPNAVPCQASFTFPNSESKNPGDGSNSAPNASAIFAGNPAMAETTPLMVFQIAPSSPTAAHMPPDSQEDGSVMENVHEDDGGLGEAGGSEVGAGVW